MVYRRTQVAGCWHRAFGLSLQVWLGLGACACQVPNPAFDASSGDAGSTTLSGDSQLSQDSADDSRDSADGSNSVWLTSKGDTSLGETASDKTSATTDHSTGGSTWSSDATTTSITSAGTEATSGASSSWPNTSEGDTSDLDVTLPELGDAVPRPLPFCPADSDLVTCLQFNGADLFELPDLSPYHHVARGYNIVRRWSHGDAQVDFLRYGWETDFAGEIWLQAHADLSFVGEARLEAWWHPLEHSLFDGYPVASLDGMLSIVTAENGYHCLLNIGDGARYAYSLTVELTTGIEYVSCSLKDGMLLIEAANVDSISKVQNVGLADLTVYAPSLHVFRGRDIGTDDRSQAAVIYGVRAWRRAQP